MQKFIDYLRTTAMSGEVLLYVILQFSMDEESQFFVAPCSLYVINLLSPYSSPLPYISVTAKAVDAYLDLRRLTEEHVRVSEGNVTPLRSFTVDVSSLNLYAYVIYDTLKSPCLIPGFHRTAIR